MPGPNDTPDIFETVKGFVNSRVPNDVQVVNAALHQNQLGKIRQICVNKNPNALFQILTSRLSILNSKETKTENDEQARAKLQAFLIQLVTEHGEALCNEQNAGENFNYVIELLQSLKPISNSQNLQEAKEDDGEALSAKLRALLTQLVSQNNTVLQQNIDWIFFDNEFVEVLQAKVDENIVYSTPCFELAVRELVRIDRDPNSETNANDRQITKAFLIQLARKNSEVLRDAGQWIELDSDTRLELMAVLGEHYQSISDEKAESCVHDTLKNIASYLSEQLAQGERLESLCDAFIGIFYSFAGYSQKKTFAENLLGYHLRGNYTDPDLDAERYKLAKAFFQTILSYFSNNYEFIWRLWACHNNRQSTNESIKNATGSALQDYINCYELICNFVKENFSELEKLGLERDDLQLKEIKNRLTQLKKDEQAIDSIAICGVEERLFEAIDKIIFHEGLSSQSVAGAFTIADLKSIAEMADCIEGIKLSLEPSSEELEIKSTDDDKEGDTVDSVIEQWEQLALEAQVASIKSLGKQYQNARDAQTQEAGQEALLFLAKWVSARLYNADEKATEQNVRNKEGLTQLRNQLINVIYLKPPGHLDTQQQKVFLQKILNCFAHQDPSEDACIFEVWAVLLGKSEKPAHIVELLTDYAHCYQSISNFLSVTLPQLSAHLKFSEDIFQNISLNGFLRCLQMQESRKTMFTTYKSQIEAIINRLTGLGLNQALVGELPICRLSLIAHMFQDLSREYSLVQPVSSGLDEKGAPSTFFNPGPNFKERNAAAIVGVSTVLGGGAGALCGYLVLGTAAKLLGMSAILASGLAGVGFGLVMGALLVLAFRHWGQQKAATSNSGGFSAPAAILQANQGT
jgi:hypothetical protein